MARKKAVKEVDTEIKVLTNEDIIVEIKQILEKFYHLSVGEGTELDDKTKVRLASYYELPNMRTPMVALIKKALISKGIVKSFKGKEQQLYDSELAEVVTEWHGSTKFNHLAWQHLLDTKPSVKDGE